MKKILFIFFILILFFSCKPLKITTETKTVYKDTTIIIFDTVTIFNKVAIFDTNIIETKKFIYKSYIDTINKIPMIVSEVEQKSFSITTKIEHKYTLTTKEKPKKEHPFRIILIMISIILFLLIILFLIIKKL